MTRLIDADALQKEMWDKCAAECGCCPYEDENLHKRCGLINNAPTVEYTFEEAFQKTVCEQKLYCPNKKPTGKWITRHKQNLFGQDVVCFECDKCQKYTLPLIGTMITEPLAVCPNCGADMRGEEE